MVSRPKKGNVIFDIKNRWIKLFGRITQTTASEFVKFLVLTHASNPDWRNPITVFLIESNGGDAVASYFIYHLLANSPSPIITCVEKKAKSGAFIISQAGFKRLIYKNAVLAFHWATYTFFKDEVYDIEKMDSLREKLRRLNSNLYRIVSRRSGLTISKVKQFFREGKILTAEEAKHFNLTDVIVTDIEKRDKDKKNEKK